ncbi:ribonuclease H-like domain-containing protein, partial [Tanacetum coccineum]
MYNEDQEELNATCIMMARIQEVNTNSKADPSYDTDGIFEVPAYDTCCINEMFYVSNHERRHLEQIESINNTYVDDQIDSNIIFDNPNTKVSSGDVDQDETSYDQNRALIESFNKSMQLDVEKYNTTNREAKETNASLTVELENYKERLDVKNAFLCGDFLETVYMHQPPGFVDPRDVSFSKKYAMKLLERAHMLNCNPAQTIVDTESKLGPEGELISDPTLYRSLAGGLQYLTFTHPDLSYVVQQIRYVQGTLEFGLQLYASLGYSHVAYSVADR